ncbi:ribosome assembly RNA-binding protein YhbY [Sporolactobacillus sp. THM19-2]|uniref:ribosome assembly RNA-binding protein YhbY n=1 Tax=Sporolactobacillus sp. THM19-2 TaxID=2511171 RepID=UPI00101FAC78|nr:ribosome assembly RNA-binding protein YhbY [Sporolactobacillus sp. THM19-2]RYL94755.1 ribosome assembly RNA-binding protein YhbY [Sporolactobacillus sp. THM19-2]
MLTGKQIKYLKKLAHPLKPVFQIGKSGLQDQLYHELSAVLEKRELIKVSLLQNTFEDVREAGTLCAKKTESELVQVIGHTFVLYRESEKHRRIELPERRGRKQG